MATNQQPTVAEPGYELGELRSGVHACSATVRWTTPNKYSLVKVCHSCAFEMIASRTWPAAAAFTLDWSRVTGVLATTPCLAERIKLGPQCVALYLALTRVAQCFVALLSSCKFASRWTSVSRCPLVSSPHRSSAPWHNDNANLYCIAELKRALSIATMASVSSAHLAAVRTQKAELTRAFYPSRTKQDKFSKRIELGQQERDHLVDMCFEPATFKHMSDLGMCNCKKLTGSTFCKQLQHISRYMVHPDGIWAQLQASRAELLRLARNTCNHPIGRCPARPQPASAGDSAASPQGEQLKQRVS
jgi:hypothetical protein